MTANELQSIVRRLANQTWCRYWLMYCIQGGKVFMAVQCRDCNGAPEEIPDLAKLGFKEDNLASSDCFYIIQRTNEDGTPLVSDWI